MRFVLDNSVTMRWLLKSLKLEDQNYAESVLKSFESHQALVPHLWSLEVINVLARAERNNEVSKSESELFLSHLSVLPISFDHQTRPASFSELLSLTRTYGLSSYDASYIELARRIGIPIATLDKDMKQAALKSNVQIFLR